MKAWIGANDAPNTCNSDGEVTLYMNMAIPSCYALKVRVLAIDQNFAIYSPPRGPGEFLSTHDAAAPSVTLDIPSAKTPAARQPRVGSCSCFRQLRAQGYGHVSTSWLVELRCRSRSHVPAPAVLHPCDAPCHLRRLVTPAAWLGGRKPARGTAQLSISRPRGPGRSARALGVVDTRASKVTAHGEAAHHA